MKIIKNKNRLGIIFTAIIVILLSGLGTIWFLSRQNSSDIVDSTQNKGSQDSATTSSGASEQPLNTTNQVPAITPPSQTDSFPIENARYRIDKVNDTSFKVTLYAIINDPSQYDEYIAQLKQYKQEATEYLRQRFGPSLAVEWNPEDAKSL